MSFDNPTFVNKEGSKKFSNMESEDEITFTTNKAKKRERILIVILIVLFVIALAFIILYAKERNDTASGSSEKGLYGGFCLLNMPLGSQFSSLRSQSLANERC